MSATLTRLLLAARPVIDHLQLPGTARLIERRMRSAHGTVRVRLSTGVRMQVDLADRVERLCAFRAYERHELALMLRLLRPGDVVVDAGAHTGYYALHAAARVGPKGAVHAFEPLPRNAERLRENAALNGFSHVVVNQAAVADTDGEATFQSVDVPGETGWGSLLIDEAAHTQALRVPTRTLDAYASAFERLDFVKLDVQGAEPAALEGARACLRRFGPKVLCEVCDTYWGRAQTATAEDVLSLMRAAGYRALRLGRGGRLTPLGEHPGGCVNVLFVRG